MHSSDSSISCFEQLVGREKNPANDNAVEEPCVDLPPHISLTDRTGYRSINPEAASQHYFFPTKHLASYSTSHNGFRPRQISAPRPRSPQLPLLQQTPSVPRPPKSNHLHTNLPYLRRRPHSLHPIHPRRHPRHSSETLSPRQHSPRHPIHPVALNSNLHQRIRPFSTRRTRRLLRRTRCSTPLHLSRRLPKPRRVPSQRQNTASHKPRILATEN